MIFQMCFAVSGALINLAVPIFGVNIYTGCGAMMIGEVISITLCGIAVKKTGRYLNNILGCDGRYFFPVVILLCGMGSFFNRSTLGSVTSDSIVFDMKNLYIITFLAIGFLCMLSAFDVSSVLGYYRELCQRQGTENKTLCEKTRELRHDIKNHIAVVDGLCRSGDTYAAKKNLGQLSGEYGAVIKRRTGNSGADFLLDDKIRSAESDCIDINCDVLFPENFISDMDMCIIISNAFDNAAAACKKLESGRYISIYGGVRGNFFVLEFENSFDGSDKIIKGTGLENIEKTVKKYGGRYDISCSEKNFTLTVMFDISRCRDIISRKSY